METIKITYPFPSVAQITLFRESKLNAVNLEMYEELRKAFEELSSNTEIRAIVLTGNEKAFTAGMDYSAFNEIGKVESEDSARAAIARYRVIKKLQNSINSIDLCRKPVIAAVSGYCLGVGVDLISATDIRYCSKSTVVSIKEIAYGMASDIGSIQRLPKLVGNNSWLREMVYTGRNAGAKEARKNGMFSMVFDSYDETLKAALNLAQEIAEKSPVAIIGCKTNLNFTRDNTVDEALNFAAYWNSWATLSTDTQVAMAAQIQKTKPVFPKL
jgi:delta(3,5)-delta(2,4)-dienoyl-CoA isomerase